MYIDCRQHVRYEARLRRASTAGRWHQIWTKRAWIPILGDVPEVKGQPRWPERAPDALCPRHNGGGWPVGRGHGSRYDPSRDPAAAQATMSGPGIGCRKQSRDDRLPPCRLRGWQMAQLHRRKGAFRLNDSHRSGAAAGLRQRMSAYPHPPLHSGPAAFGQDQTSGRQPQWCEGVETGPKKRGDLTAAADPKHSAVGKNRMPAIRQGRRCPRRPGYSGAGSPSGATVRDQALPLKRTASSEPRVASPAL
jgi:hypothetical protein